MEPSNKLFSAIILEFFFVYRLHLSRQRVFRQPNLYDLPVLLGVFFVRRHCLGENNVHNHNVHIS